MPPGSLALGGMKRRLLLFDAASLFQTNHVVHWNAPRKDIFFCMASWLFRTACCSFTTCSSPRKTFTGRFASKKPLRIFLIIFYLQLLNSAVMLTVLWQTKTTVASPLEDKHLVSRHHVIRSEKVVTPHKKNHLTWCFSRYHVIGLEKICLFQSVTLKAAKKKLGYRGPLRRVILPRQRI